MTNADGSDGSFLGRWSQRKVKARQDALPVAEPTVPAEAAKPAAEISKTSASQPLAAAAAGSQPEAPDQLPQPTLEDVAKLTSESDYSAFAARHVDASVRNAAMRKLFSANPHFNVMDGLDVYIDDYSIGVPIPKSMMRQMVQARSLGLLDDELVDQDKPPLAELPTDVAANDNTNLHENTDLQLQRDDAAGHSGTGDRPQPSEDRFAARGPDFDTQRNANEPDDGTS